MAWKVVATILAVVFAIVALQATVAGPMVQVTTDLADSGDYDDNGHFDGEQIISDTLSSWFNMGLVAIFGMIAWGAQYVIRRELTRGGL